ncbi:MAG: hypothetical protein HC845_14165 [Akkermansiaceae bacterium]|nr:hypothetical protein [Akkermansiaceae bacterium]
MHTLTTLKISALTIGLAFSFLCHAEESASSRKLAPMVVEDAEEVDGPNVRVMKFKDGSREVLVRTPDNKKITKTRKLNDEVIMVTRYTMDENGNPLGCKIYDGQKQELFKVSYGYHKVTGLLERELMFDARVKRIDKDTGKETPIQIIAYIYDAEGKRSAPIVYNLLPGKKFEDVFGIKSSELGENPFKDGN